MSKKRIAVICPGRGSYTRDTINYLQQNGNPAKEYVKWMDENIGPEVQ